MEEGSTAVVDVKDKKKWLENAFKKKDEDATASTLPKSRNLVEDRHQWIQDKLLTQAKGAIPPQTTVTEAPKSDVAQKEEEETLELPSESVLVEGSTETTTSTAELEAGTIKPPPAKDEGPCAEAHVPVNETRVADNVAESNKVAAKTPIVNEEPQQVSEPSLPETEQAKLSMEEKNPNIMEKIGETVRDEIDNTPTVGSSKENEKDVIDAHFTGPNNGPFATDETIDEPPEEMEFPEEAIDPLPEESDDDDDDEEQQVEKETQTEIPTESINANRDLSNGLILDQITVTPDQIDRKPTIVVDAPTLLAAGIENVEDCSTSMEGHRHDSTENASNIDGPSAAIDQVFPTERSDIASDEQEHGALSTIAVAEVSDATGESNDIEKLPAQTIQPPETAQSAAVEEIPTTNNEVQRTEHKVGTSVVLSSTGVELAEGEAGISENVKSDDPTLVPVQNDVSEPAPINAPHATKGEENQEISNQVFNQHNTTDECKNGEQLISITTSRDEEDVCEQQIEITQLSGLIPDEDPVFLGDFESPHKQPQDNTRETTASPDDLNESPKEDKFSTTNEDLLVQDTTEETIIASNLNHQHDSSTRREDDTTSTMVREEQRPVRVKDIITIMSSESSANKIGLTPLAKVAVHSSTNPNSPSTDGDKAGINKHVIDMSQMDFLYTRKGKAFVEQAKKNAKKLREVRDDILTDECCSGVLAKETAANQDPPQEQVPSLLDKDRSDHEATDSSDVHYAQQGASDVHCTKQGLTQPMSPSKRSEADSSAEINVHCLESCAVM